MATEEVMEIEATVDFPIMTTRKRATKDNVGAEEEDPDVVPSSSKRSNPDSGDRPLLRRRMATNGKGNNDGPPLTSIDNGSLRMIPTSESSPASSSSTESAAGVRVVTPPPSAPPPPPSDEIVEALPGPNADGEWEVESIEDYKRTGGGGHRYLIKWKGWDSTTNTWEPLTNLKHCAEELVRFYLERKKMVEEATKLKSTTTEEDSSNSNLGIGRGCRPRRRPPTLPLVPPDPRPLHVRLTEYLGGIGKLPSQAELDEVASELGASVPKPVKSAWPLSQVEKTLEEVSIQGKRGHGKIQGLKKQLMLILVETDQVKELKNWETHMNNITGRKPTIHVENKVDYEGRPKSFQFFNYYIPGAGVVIPSDPPFGCECGGSGDDTKSCWGQRGTGECCPDKAGHAFAYNELKRLNVKKGTPIYECNSKCLCPPECTNRVVQDGQSEHELVIFRTSNGRGWGVKTLQAIKKGSFVTLYVGEVITNEEAERRGRDYDADGVTYLFDLDFADLQDHPYTVDAYKIGNVSHFINHACRPNLVVHPVWVDCLDPDLPKLAMFALRDIKKNEELTLDYQQRREDTNNVTDGGGGGGGSGSELRDRTPCLCGHVKCRGFIF